MHIGLQEAVYHVSEDDGTLTVCAQINVRELEMEVAVNFTTIDGTASSTGQMFHKFTLLAVSVYSSYVVFFRNWVLHSPFLRL